MQTIRDTKLTSLKINELWHLSKARTHVMRHGNNHDKIIARFY